MSKPRLTSSVRWGLRELLSLVESDVDADRSAPTSRWTTGDFKKVQRAMEYLQYIATEDQPKAR